MDPYGVNLEALRAAPAGWDVWQASRDVERAQRTLLRRILERNANTEFGRAHGLDRRMTSADFRRAVPIRRFGDLSPWIDRMVEGEREVLVPGRPEMFSRTSGSTLRSKYVPVTHDGVRVFQHLAGLWMSMAIADVPAAGTRRIIGLTSTTQEILPSGIPAGTTTFPRQTPAGLMGGRLLIVPPSLHRPPDFEHRRFAQLLFTLANDVSMIAVTAPTTLIVLFERLQAWGDDLVDELARAPLSPPDGPPPDVDGWRARVAWLRRVLAEDGKLTPKRAWPELALMGSFIEGPSSIYVSRLAELSGGIMHRNVGYCASEGRLAVTLSAGSPGGVLMAAHYVVELVEELAARDGSAISMSAREAEVGKRYRPVITSTCGLYRYDVEDVVEVIDRFGELPVIAFCHRDEMVALAGELMTELQVVIAMKRAAEALAIGIVDFVAEPTWIAPEPPFYAFAVETTPGGDFDRVELEVALERELASVNREYADKRRWARLSPPRVSVAPPGHFLALRHEKLALGTPDTRYKLAHLRTQVRVVERNDIVAPS